MQWKIKGGQTHIAVPPCSKLQPPEGKLLRTEEESGRRGGRRNLAALWGEPGNQPARLGGEDSYQHALALPVWLMYSSNS